MILMIIKLISLLKYGKSATHRNRQVPLTSRCVDNVCALQAAHLGRVRYLEHIHFSLCLDSSGLSGKRNTRVSWSHNCSGRKSVV